MAVTALIGISLLIGPNASLTSLGTTTIDVVSDQTWSVVPLFTWMGLIVVASGFAEELYRAAYRWIGHLPGGLASASTVACAGLSSIVGDTLSGVYSMGSIALPQMRTYGYDMKLATASIACAATIGVMIPPSLAFIVYGMITEVSIGKLFIAGIAAGHSCSRHPDPADHRARDAQSRARAARRSQQLARKIDVERSRLARAFADAACARRHLFRRGHAQTRRAGSASSARL